MFKQNNWDTNQKFNISKIANNYFKNSKSETVATACGSEINTACGSEVNTACGSEIVSSACGSEINTACGSEIIN